MAARAEVMIMHLLEPEDKTPVVVEVVQETIGVLVATVAVLVVKV